MSEGRRGVLPADQAVNAVLSGPELLGEGFRRYERYKVTLAEEEGPWVATRDILRQGRVVAVLPIDLERDKIVLIQQFRLGAHFATGKGLLIEAVAGFLDADETPVQAARRECQEELGVGPHLLVEALTLLTSPGLSDEKLTVFVATVDSSAVPVRAGLAREHEITRPIVVSIDRVLAALAAGLMCNGPLIVALQWLALNHGRLRDIMAAGSTRL